MSPKRAQMDVRGVAMQGRLSLRLLLPLAVVLVVGSALAAAITTEASASTPSRPPILWSETTAKLEAAAGSSSEFEVTFISSKTLQDVTIRVVPALAKFISVKPTRFTTVRAGIPQHLTVRVAVPSTQAPGVFAGVIQVRRLKVTVPHTLPTCLTVTEPPALLGDATIDPDGVFAGSTASVHVAVPYVGDDSPEALSLIRVDPVSGDRTNVGDLHDDGTGGDSLAGDGIFEADVLLMESTPGDFPLVIKVVSAGRTSYSSQLTLHVRAETPAETMLAIDQIYTEAATRFDAALQATNVSGELQALIAWLLGKSEVAGASLQGTQVDIVFADGSTRSLLDFAPGMRGGSVAAVTDCFAPFISQFAPYDETPYIHSLMGTLPGGRVFLQNDSVDVESMKDMSTFGVVYASTHGSTDSKGVTRIVTRERPSFSKDYGKYYWDLLLNRLHVVAVRVNSSVVSYYAVTPSFVRKYNARFPNSIVVMSACESAKTDSMARAFLDKGAGSYFGYSKSVDSRFADRTGKALFDNMIGGGMSSLAAFNALGSRTDPGSPNAEFRMYGSGVTISGSVLDGSFETGSLAGWSRSGDTRVVTRLGSIRPIHGKYMALLATGLGSQSDTDSLLSRDFAVPGGKTRLVLNYNFVTEEFPEFVGSIFDDNLRIEVVASSGAVIGSLYESVNSSSFVGVPGIDFPGGDSTCGMTGWKTGIINVSAIAGRGSISVRIKDEGDSIYDSAAVLDNIRFE